MIELTTEQRTFDWYKARFGMFTASQINKLMVATDLKSNSFTTEKAKGYLNLLAGERFLKQNTWDSLSDEEKQNFIWNQYPSNSAMKWGTFYEDTARKRFSFENDKDIEEFGSCVNDERPYISASPDGYIKAENALVEIKCPEMQTYVAYTDSIVDAESLKKNKMEYYWQIMLQMYVTGADKCYFVWYHPLIGIEYAIIERNQADIDFLLKRIDEAEKIVCNKFEKL